MLLWSYDPFHPHTNSNTHMEAYRMADPSSCPTFRQVWQQEAGEVEWLEPDERSDWSFPTQQPTLSSPSSLPSLPLLPHTWLSFTSHLPKPYSRSKQCGWCRARTLSSKKAACVREGKVKDTGWQSVCEHQCVNTGAKKSQKQTTYVKTFCVHLQSHSSRHTCQ